VNDFILLVLYFILNHDYVQAYLYVTRIHALVIWSLDIRSSCT